MIELYEFDISGNCHKVRLLLSLLNISYQSIELNRTEREQKSAEFLAKNSFGQVPVLKDGDLIIRDSQAILVYLARAYGEEKWFPNDAVQAAEITQWLSTAANEIAHGPAALRAHHKLGRAINLEAANQITQNLLNILEAQLAHKDWLATDNLTIADIAVYPYIALANEGKVDLADFPAIRKWLGRIEKLDGFVSMAGIELQS
ncbi:glutathione S-transferase [Cellvibrio zantedeschiae]|uniref:Glutathione S-transferase n=1 Tax=Cellvibrio zantedeschiae TaxID=1237077 RepID=A0ABQ3B7W0_9GAMM|nr:glutathione S-transferase [Cellvibrio zantedeschiae]GGY83229.1 glutathione S-transferase [Cellvibrio zantedeschiae]